MSRIRRSVSADGGGVDRDIIRPVELKAGILDHLFDAVAGMDALQPKPPPRAVEGEQAAVGDQRDRAAGAEHVVGLPPGALMKSTFGTSVRRECSTRNRITLGTT